MNNGKKIVGKSRKENYVKETWCFSTKKKKEATHVGIYLKDNRFIHASTSRGVIISNLDEEYWKKHWLSGGRP